MIGKTTGGRAVCGDVWHGRTGRKGENSRGKRVVGSLNAVGRDKGEIGE